MPAHRRGVGKLEALVLVRGSHLGWVTRSSSRLLPGAGRNRVAPDPAPPPHGRCAKWEIKELPRAPRGLADPAPQEGVGGREPEGRAFPRAPAALPESECLVCCSLTLKLNRSPTTFNTPPDSRKPKDFSLEWEPETFQISLRFREIKLPLSPWMPSMARGHSQSPFSSVPD